jgi:uncharacterized membrane protein
MTHCGRATPSPYRAPCSLPPFGGTSSHGRLQAGPAAPDFSELAHRRANGINCTPNPLNDAAEPRAVAPLPPRASFLTTSLVGVGLLCCIYLAALKVINLPCPLSGCGVIINSRYGSLFGVPLPLFAIPLWVVLALPASSAWQARTQLVSVVLLALGGVVLMGIQFLVLRGFCPFCTLHALAALAAAFSFPLRGRAHAWLPALMLALALPLVLVVKLVGEAQLRSPDAPGYSTQAAPVGAAPAAAPAKLAYPTNIDAAAFRWLGEFDAKQSPILVVSLQCGHCLSLLEGTLKSPQFGVFKGPKVFVYAQPQEAQDSIDVLAAMLSVPGTQQEQFATVFGQIDSLRDPLLTHDSKELHKRLAVLFPLYTEKLAAARQEYNVQVVALKFVPGKGSPYLLMPDGTSSYGVVPADLLFH